MKTASAADRINLMFRAFSDRTRLRILHLLQGGECCVGDVGEVLDVEQPNASRHLSYLRRAGLVRVRKTKNWSYYSLAPAEEPFHAKLLECLVCCFAQVPEMQADQARAKKVREPGWCCPGQEETRAGKPRKSDKGERCCPR